MNFLRMLEDVTDLETEAKDLWSKNIEPIVELVLWILVIVLAVVFIVKAILTALAVMKAADEPQVRQEKLNGFKYLAIGLGVAIVVITLAATIMRIVTQRTVSLEDAMLF